MPASPRSMTGYGAARADGSRFGVEIEIRSVNARSFKLNTRTPPLLAPHESDIEALVRKTVRRGTEANGPSSSTLRATTRLVDRWTDL